MKKITLFIIISIIGNSSSLLSEDIKSLYIGFGHSEQYKHGRFLQKNTLLDLNIFLKKYNLSNSGNSQFLLGAGYSYLTTDADINKEIHVLSVLPSYRYFFLYTQNFIYYIHLTLGPSIMSSESLGVVKQGSQLLFNDYVGAGIKWGQKSELELMLLWRHLSNGGLFPPNPGIDVNYNISLCWYF